MRRQPNITKFRRCVIVTAWVMSACRVNIHGKNIDSEGRQEIEMSPGVVMVSNMNTTESIFQLAKERFEARTLDGSFTVRGEEGVFQQVQVSDVDVIQLCRVFLREMT